MWAVAGLSDLELAISVLIVTAGATVQASIGIGLGLIAAPLLTLIDPQFVPGALVLAVFPMTLAMAWRERDHIDVAGVTAAIPGRFVGVIVGSIIVANTGVGVTAIVIGVSVLIAVVASLSGKRLPMTPINLAAAGAASGIGGAVAAIGGPPMALAYQHDDPATLRSTLAMFHVVGSAFTVPALVIAGEIGSAQVRLAGLIVGGVIAGLVIGERLRTRLPQHQVRAGVLVVCAVSAAAVLARYVG